MVCTYTRLGKRRAWQGSTHPRAREERASGRPTERRVSASPMRTAERGSGQDLARAHLPWTVPVRAWRPPRAAEALPRPGVLARGVAGGAQAALGGRRGGARRAARLLTARLRPGAVPLRPVGVAQFATHRRKVLEGGDRGSVRRAQHLLPDGQGLAVALRRLAVLPRGVVHEPEVVVRLRRDRMLRPQHLLPNRQPPAQCLHPPAPAPSRESPAPCGGTPKPDHKPPWRCTRAQGCCMTARCRDAPPPAPSPG
eukprot:scaffold463_cov351-Prasinococcus_capsulatus_cf.AAC.1